MCDQFFSKTSVRSFNKSVQVYPICLRVNLYKSLPGLRPGLKVAFYMRRIELPN